MKWFSLRWPTQPIGIMDSGSVRRAGEEDDRENELKHFVAVQRVRLPPGKGAARQPEASLARAVATLLVKRRQQVLKPCVSPDIMIALKPSACWARGQQRCGR